MVSEYRKVFSLFDQDDSGFITVKELVTVLRSLGKDSHTTDAQKMIACFDREGII